MPIPIKKKTNKKPAAQSKPQTAVTFNGWHIQLQKGAFSRLRLTVLSPGKARLNIPRHLSEDTALAFLQAQKAWLQKQRQRLESQPGFSFFALGTVWYRGKAYPLLEGPPGFTGQAFTAPHTPAGEKAFYRFWAVLARHEAEPMVQEEAARMGLPAPAVRWRRMTSRWGSCLWQEGRITLNVALLMLPERLQRYVIVHELAHLRHPDHQRGFHTLLEAYCPGEKGLRAELRGYRLQ